MTQVNLNPGRGFIIRNRYGDVNLTGTIRSIIAHLPNGETFSASAMATFLAECGAGGSAFKYSGRVNSSLNNIARNYGELTKDATSYYRVSHGRTGVSFSAKKEKKGDRTPMSIDEINESLFGV